MLCRRVDTNIGLVHGQRLAELLQHLTLVTVNLLYRNDLASVARLQSSVYRQLHRRCAADKVAQASTELFGSFCRTRGGRFRVRIGRRGLGG